MFLEECRCIIFVLVLMLLWPFYSQAHEQSLDPQRIESLYKTREFVMPPVKQANFKLELAAVD